MKISMPLWLLLVVVFVFMLLLSAKMNRRSDDRFVRVVDREQRVWYIQRSQVLSIEPTENIAGFGEWTNGCFVRLSTRGFPIQFDCEADKAARLVGIR